MNLNFNSYSTKKKKKLVEFSLLNVGVSSLLSLEHLRPWRKFWSQGQLTTAEDHKHIILEKWLLVSGLDFNFHIELPNVSNFDLFLKEKVSVISCVKIIPPSWYKNFLCMLYSWTTNCVTNNSEISDSTLPPDWEIQTDR